MKRVLVVMLLFAVIWPVGAVVVADSVYRSPLPNASVFDRRGRPVGICGADGRLPYVSPPDYPITIRYIGYEEKTVPYADYDTIFLCENVTQLPDLVVNSKQKRVLHILAYVREFSTLSTYTDTVTLFREKMVDFMVSVDCRVKSFGWSTPRVLDSESYYRFTDRFGLDSVSNRAHNHFSWADWVGLPQRTPLPASLLAQPIATDTLRGKYSAAEIWRRNGDHVSIGVNVLADTTARKWVPGLSQFFHNHLDFERFTVCFNFANVVDDAVGPEDLASYSFNIESNGRGLQMFRFNRRDEPVFVSTYGEVYIFDKRFIPLKEAKKWERLDVSEFEPGIFVPEEVPPLPAEVAALVERVESIDHSEARLALTPDHRLAGKRDKKFNVGTEILGRFKQMFGIDYVLGKRKWNRQWKGFRAERRDRNNARPMPQEAEE